MFDSVEYEICPAKILKLLKTGNSFLLNTAEHENFFANKYENASYCWHFHVDWQRKFHAQLSWSTKKMFYNLKPGYYGVN